MYFKDIPGHSDLKSDLIQMSVNQRLPHTMLFHGRSGTALLAMARALGRYIMCANPTDDDACGKCPKCRKIDIHQHPDFHFAFPVVAFKDEAFDRQMMEFQQLFRSFLNTHPFGSVPEWLDILKAEKKQINISKSVIMHIIKRLSLKSYETGATVMIIWMPEYMANEGNRLLKLLEEPPPGAYILMVTEEPERILSTILSRSQQVRLLPYSDMEIVASTCETS
jgi:DNA polymerase-3 subunit delta'